MSTEANSNIPYGRQTISEDDIQAVVATLRSDWLTQGPAIDRFEKIVAEYCGCRYAVAVNSATSALHIACLAAELGPGDTLWTSTNTFVASANCSRYCGGDVGFIDIDPATLNMGVDELERQLFIVNQHSKLPKVVVPVHFAGQSCEMDRIAELSKQYGFTTIEDASHAIGGSYQGKKIGSCAFSDMTVFSFHPVKIITTGEGGMVLTNSEDLFQKLIRLRSHGITRETALMNTESHGAWYYQQIELGFNYRMTDIQASLGISQMKRLDEFVAKRNELANRYDQALRVLPISLPLRHPSGYSAFHLYVIRVPKMRKQIFNYLRQEAIGVNVHYIPVHTQPYYQQLGFKIGDFPEAERYYEEAITLPLYPGMTYAQQDRVINILKKAIAA